MPAAICIRKAKNDPFGHGAQVVLGKTNSLVVALSNFRPPGAGPWESGLPLLRTKAALQFAGLNPFMYSGHSIGSSRSPNPWAGGLQMLIVSTLGHQMKL